MQPIDMPVVMGLLVLYMLCFIKLFCHGISCKVNFYLYQLIAIYQHYSDMDESLPDEEMSEVAYVLDEDAEEIIDIIRSNEDDGTTGNDNDDDDDDNNDSGAY